MKEKLELFQSQNLLTLNPDGLRVNLASACLNTSQITALANMVKVHRFLWKQGYQSDGHNRQIFYLGFQNRKIGENTPQNAFCAMSVLASNHEPKIPFNISLTQILPDSRGMRRIVETTYDLNTNRLTKMGVGLGIFEATELQLKNILLKARFSEIQSNLDGLIVTDCMLATVGRQRENITFIKAYSPVDLSKNEFNLDLYVDRFGFSCRRNKGTVEFKGKRQGIDWEIKVPSSF